MKTLHRPQENLTIAISRAPKNHKKLHLAVGSASKVTYAWHKFIVILPFLFFVFIPENPEIASEICVKNHSEQICEVW